MDVGPLTYAFAAGALSAFNPCGFVLLPTYAASFLAGEASSPMVRLARVASAMSAGFFTVFALAGLLVGVVGVAVPETLPSTLVLVVAATMAGVGVLLASGRSLPGFSLSLGSVRTSYSYGVAYAAASLACTLPVFLSAVVFAFSREGGFLSGFTASIGYAAGMSAAVLAVLTALSYAGQGAISRMRRSSGLFSRLAGSLLMGGAALLAARELLGLQALDRAASYLQGAPAATALLLAALAASGTAARKLGRRGDSGRNAGTEVR